MDVADAINIMLYASPRTRKKKATVNVTADPISNFSSNSNPDEIAVDDDENVNLGQTHGNGVESGGENDMDVDMDMDKEPDMGKAKEIDMEKEQEASKTDKAESITKPVANIEPDKEDEDEDEEEEQPGCAVWDLFRAEDADKIRQFLREKYANQVYFTDPIHSQIFYLDSDLRRELAEKYGVVSYRVYQYVVSHLLN